MIKVKKTFLIIILIATLLAGLLIGFGTAYFARESLIENFNNTESIVLKNNDNLRNYKLIDYNGNSVNLNVSKPHSIVYYLDKDCGNCLESLSVVDTMTQVLPPELFDIIVIWNLKARTGFAESMGVKKENIYISNNIRLSSSTPTFFILDSQGRINFTSVTWEDLVKRVLEYEDTNLARLQKNADAFLQEKYSSEKKDGELPFLIYFAMEGCADCAAAEPIVYSSDLVDKYNILTLYRDRENVPSELNEFIDKKDFLATIYDVSWYPSFRIISSNQTLDIGEVPLSELKEMLLQAANKN